MNIKRALISIFILVILFTGCSIGNKNRDHYNDSKNAPVENQDTSTSKNISTDAPSNTAGDATIKNQDTDISKNISDKLPREDTTEPFTIVNNLMDKASINKVLYIMENAGISKDAIIVFQEHVNQVISCKGFRDIPAGNRIQKASELLYDPYSLQDYWNREHPKFIGYNCRITAFSLMKDFIDVKNLSKEEDTNLFMDREALNADTSALPHSEDRDKFFTFYNTIKTVNSKDVKDHVDVLNKAWKSRGISFKENAKMSLISLIFHNQFSKNENELSIGHTGVLFDLGDKGICFLEKLAFQEPYDVIYAKDKAELSKYLMAKYNIDYNQPTAPVFIMENDHLMKLN